MPLWFEALWPSHWATQPSSYVKATMSVLLFLTHSLTSSPQWHTFQTAFVHFFFSPSNLHVSPFKPILMFSLALHVPTLGKKKSPFPLASKFSHWGTNHVPKFKQHPGQCEGWGEQEVDQCSSQAMLTSVWEKIAGLLTLQGNKKGLRK